VLAQPQDGLGSPLRPHATLQQHHTLIMQHTLPHSASSACGLPLAA